MKYLIDEQGIHYLIEDAEADRVAVMQDERALSRDDLDAIPLPDALAACRKVSAELSAALGDGDALQ